MKLKNKRREFLKNAALAACLAPVTRFWQDLGFAEDAPPPKRLMLVFLPNGYGSQTVSEFVSGTENSWNFGTQFNAMTEFKSDIIAFKRHGFKDLIDASYSGEGNGHAAAKVLFTGHVEQAGTSPGTPKGCQAPSIDQIVANVFASRNQLGSLGDPTAKSLHIWLGGSGWFDDHVFFQAPGYTIGKTYEGQSLPGVSRLSQLRDAFDRYFGPFLNGGKVVSTPQSATFEALWARGKSFLDAPSAQLTQLKTTLPKEGGDLLDRHLFAMRELEISLQAPALTVTEKIRDLGASPPTNIDVNNRAQIRALVEAWHLLIRNLFMADLVRVVTMQHGGGSSRTNIPELSLEFVGVSGDPNSGYDHHSHTHYQNKANLDKIAGWYSARHAHLLRTLKGQPGDENLLASSLVMWSHELGDGGGHSPLNIPTVLAGQAGGAVRTGRMLDLSNSGRSHTALLLAICQAMGVTTLTSVGHPAYAGQTVQLG